MNNDNPNVRAYSHRLIKHVRAIDNNNKFNNKMINNNKFAVEVISHRIKRTVTSVALVSISKPVVKSKTPRWHG